jgi:hypothetical protein
MDWNVPVHVWSIELNGQNAPKDAAVRTLLHEHGYTFHSRIRGHNEIFVHADLASSVRQREAVCQSCVPNMPKTMRRQAEPRVDSAVAHAALRGVAKCTNWRGELSDDASPPMPTLSPPELPAFTAAPAPASRWIPSSSDSGSSSGDADFDTLLTTIVTDAPHASGSSLLAETVASLVAVPGLSDRVRIVFDGGPLPVGREWNDLHWKCKQPADLQAYAAYRENMARRLLSDVAVGQDWRVIELPVRGCLSAAVHAGVSNASSRFIAVIQNDLPLQRTFDLHKLLQIMIEHPRVQKVSFSAGSNRCVIQAATNVCKQHRRIPRNASFRSVTFDDYGLPLTPVPYWFDGNHVASTSHYRRVFSYIQPQGGFMEDKLFCRPWVSHEPWGTYLLGNATPTGGFYSSHRNARNNSARHNYCM